MDRSIEEMERESNAIVRGILRTLAKLERLIRHGGGSGRRHVAEEKRERPEV